MALAALGPRVNNSVSDLYVMSGHPDLDGKDSGLTFLRLHLEVGLIRQLIIGGELGPISMSWILYRMGTNYL